MCGDCVVSVLGCREMSGLLCVVGLSCDGAGLSTTMRVVVAEWLFGGCVVGGCLVIVWLLSGN